MLILHDGDRDASANPQSPLRRSVGKMSPTSGSNHLHDGKTRKGSHDRPPGARASPRRGHDAAAEECERLLDKELIDTFPAGDPPSWTMGGSLVSHLHH